MSQRCTEKQAAVLRKFDYPDDLSQATANRIISALAKNNWQPLRGKEDAKYQKVVRRDRGWSRNVPGVVRDVGPVDDHDCRTIAVEITYPLGIEVGTPLVLCFQNIDG